MRIIKRLFDFLHNFFSDVLSFLYLKKLLNKYNIKWTIYDDDFWGSLITYKSPACFSNEKLCFFSHYDKDNKISDRVIYYVNAIFQQGFDVVFISTSFGMRSDEIEKITGIVSQVILRKNVGYDFGSWKTAYQCVDDIQHYSMLVIANDSVIGPVTSLTDMFKSMEKSEYNVWGITDNYEIKYHAQSYFLAFDKTVLNSSFLDDFMSGIKVLKDKSSVINKYEIGLSQSALHYGFKVGAYCRYDDVVNHAKNENHKYKDMLAVKQVNSTLWLSDILLKICKTPFVKVELLRDNPHSVDLTETIAFIDYKSDFPIDYIKEYLN